MTWDLVLLAVGLTLLTVVGVLLLVPALFRRSGDVESALEYDMAVYADQLAELDQEVESGAIAPAEAAAARAEIERRMLRAAAESSASGRRSGRPLSHVAAVLIVAAVPVTAGGLYLYIGSPGLPDMPLQARMDLAPAQPDPEEQDLATLTEQLAERMEQRPDDPLGWTMLGRSYRALGRFAEAAGAFERAVELSDDPPPGLLTDLAEVLVMGAGGAVPPEAIDHVGRALDADPLDPKARFYLAEARDQAGDRYEALAILRGVEDDSAPDAPWMATVRGRIARLSGELGVDPQDVEPRHLAETAPATPLGATGPAPGDDQQMLPEGLGGSVADGGSPTPGQMAAMQDMSPEERARAIRGMVERLAARMEAEPENLDGWIRLGRAWTVLGEREEAIDAIERAQDLVANRLNASPDDADRNAGELEAAAAALEYMREEAENL